MSQDPVRARIAADTLSLARQLVARRSITPADDGCLAVIESRLQPLGFRCERIDREGITNLWARYGSGAPLVCFAGHIDVVPTGPVEEWTVPPFEGVERGGFLYGRGTADMKVSVAAMTTAAERVVASLRGGDGSIALLLTADEEGDALHGTAAVVDALTARNERIDHCLVGEPTSSERFGDTVKNGRRGSLSGNLRVKGVQCHVAYPERGRNPIHQAAPALAELSATSWDRGNDYFGPTTFQISNIHAGTGAPNVVPGTLDVQFNLRFSPESPAAGLQQRIQAVLSRHGLEYDVQWTVSAEPFLTPAGTLVDAVRTAVKDVTGVTPALSTSGGTSDGRFLSKVAGQVVEFGPMNDTIHKIDERVAVSDIGPLSIIYERIARSLLGLKLE